MRRIEILFLIIFFLFSCAKEGKNIYIQGRVVNPETGEGIHNITLELRKKVGDIGGSGSSTKTIKTVHSDIDGYFTIWHNGSLFNKYIVHASETNGIGYLELGWKDLSGNQLPSGYNLEVNKGELMNVRFELVPFANVKYNFNNVNCFDSTDELHVYISDKYDSYLPIAWEHNGCVNYLGSFDGLKPMGLYNINWDVYRNGNLQSFSDTFYLNEGDMRTYTINY